MNATASLEHIVVLGLAAYLVARVIVNDKVWKGTRDRLLTFLGNRETRSHRRDDRLRCLLYFKAGELLGCPLCMGVWVAAALTCLHASQWPWQLGVAGWITVAAVAGAQGTLAVITSD